MKIDLNSRTELESVSRKKKAKSKRSLMLKMIMPMLSDFEGEQLATAIEENDSKKAKAAMDKISSKLAKKLQTAKK